MMRSSAAPRIFASLFAAVGLVCAGAPPAKKKSAPAPTAAQASPVAEQAPAPKTALALDPTDQWPAWRGPLSTGVAPHATPPVEWSEDKNIRWKAELPGKGHSTPVVWGDRVFVTTAVPFGDPFPAKFSGAPGAHDETPITQKEKFVVLALDRRTGKVVWERTMREEVPHQGGHVTASLASNSPLTDGEHLFASFGSGGLYCLDFDGDLVWQKDFGHLESLHGHGEGSTPALYGNTLIVNWDHEGDSFLVALDKHTGRELWKTPREHASSWSSPIVVELPAQQGQPARAQVIVSGSQRIRGYDLADGKMIWECAGLSVENVVSSPVAGRGLVFSGSTYDSPGMLAIRLDGATGDLTGTDHVAWRHLRGAPYVPSPLLSGDALYFLNHFQGGIITRVNARTGEDQPGAFRLPNLRNIFASPVAAAGRIYVPSREGLTVVLTDAANLEILAQNRLDDHFSASPAVAGKELFLRGEKYLYCIAAE